MFAQKLAPRPAPPVVDDPLVVPVPVPVVVGVDVVPVPTAEPPLVEVGLDDVVVPPVGGEVAPELVVTPLLPELTGVVVDVEFEFDVVVDWLA